MGKLTNNLKTNFSQIPNDLIEDSDLSDRARFVYCYMASRPDGWEFWNNQLARVLGYSIDTLRKYMKELHYAGWLINRGQTSNGTKFSNNDYELMATNLTVAEITVPEKTRHGKTPTHSNTDFINNTEVNNTDVGNDEPTAVIEYLNEASGSKYRPVESNTKFIKARIAEGYTVKDMLDVINFKVEEWKGTKFEKFLRPATLFNAEKFNQYFGLVGEKQGEIDWTAGRQDYIGVGYERVG